MTARGRLAVLRRLFEQQPGPITTGMVHAHYQAQGIAPQRTTARMDLKMLVAQGLLYETGPDDDRKFWLKPAGGGR
jgi:hypothetical protein